MASSRTRKSRRVIREDNSDALPEEEPREAGKNPMLIDVILSNMFGYCDFATLAQCRLVSKQWFKASLPTWLAKGPTLKLSLSIGPRGYVSMSTFLERVHSAFHSYGPYALTGLRQYRKFAVTGYATHTDQHVFLQNFLRLCGHSVTELKLELEIPDMDAYRALLLSTMCPNLVKVSACIRFHTDMILVEDVKYEGDEDKEEVEEEECFEILAEEQKQLTCLEIDYPGYSFESLSSLPASGWIQLLKRYPNLKTLLVGDRGMTWMTKKLVGPPADIPNQHGSDRVLQTLTPLFRDGQLKLSLETLGLSLGEQTPPQTIVELLASQATTLRNLSISRKSPLKNFKPPELPLVQSLELAGRPIRNLASLLSPSFQQLKSLVLTCINVPDYVTRKPYDNDKLAKMLRGGTRNKGSSSCMLLPTLAKLHCDYGSGVAVVKNPLGPDDIRKLARFFPNLTDLQLWLNNESLRSVVQNWSDLQHLTIIGDGVDDKGISGVIRYLPRMTDMESIAMKHSRGPTALSEKSLAKFLKPPNLERLEISLDEQVRVGPALLRKLEGKIKTLKITRAKKLPLPQVDSDASTDEDTDSDSE